MVISARQSACQLAFQEILSIPFRKNGRFHLLYRPGLAGVSPVPNYSGQAGCLSDKSMHDLSYSGSNLRIKYYQILYCIHLGNK